MFPTFWKLSQGGNLFSFDEMIKTVHKNLVYIHRGCPALGTMSKTQAELFVEAPTGDYVYVTHGNDRIYLFGQFSGPANYFSDVKGGWIDRPVRVIALSNSSASYTGVEKWWTPNHRSTFARVQDDERKLFGELILQPYFGIQLTDYEL